MKGFKIEISYGISSIPVFSRPLNFLFVVFCIAFSNLIFQNQYLICFLRYQYIYRLAQNLQFSFIGLPSSRIIGVHYHIHYQNYYFKQKVENWNNLQLLWKLFTILSPEHHYCELYSRLPWLYIFINVYLCVDMYVYGHTFILYNCTSICGYRYKHKKTNINKIL